MQLKTQFVSIADRDQPVNLDLYSYLIVIQYYILFHTYVRTCLKIKNDDTIFSFSAGKGLKVSRYLRVLV